MKSNMSLYEKHRGLNDKPNTIETLTLHDKNKRVHEKFNRIETETLGLKFCVNSHREDINGVNNSITSHKITLDELKKNSNEIDAKLNAFVNETNKKIDALNDAVGEHYISVVNLQEYDTEIKNNYDSQISNLRLIVNDLKAQIQLVYNKIEQHKAPNGALEDIIFVRTDSETNIKIPLVKK